MGLCLSGHTTYSVRYIWGYVSRDIRQVVYTIYGVRLAWHNKLPGEIFRTEKISVRIFRTEMFRTEMFRTRMFSVRKVRAETFLTQSISGGRLTFELKCFRGSA